ncbi:hypothetical protein L916_17364 [Phytophthora nicotianae]|uniref:Uncharacterized protein n=1 Tax=Phytophthora nicotianae TaxID=4792 RepID=W2I7M6_PHYNI|nr:hypothetical protein L916_17364 [Phytophthora nicotianae]
MKVLFVIAALATLLMPVVLEHVLTTDMRALGT